MFTRSLRIAVLLTLSSFAIAQQMSQQSHRHAIAPADDTCAAVFVSGVDHNETSYCVTVNGNIAQFSRDGDEYLKVGGIAEGYGVCDLTSNIGYFDYAYDSGNLLASTFSANANVATSTRLSSDRIWQIKNTITKVAANATDPGSAKIVMQLKNLTNTERGIYVFRFADVDFWRRGVDYFENDFDFTRDTAVGLGGNQIDFSTGLSLTNNTFVNVGVRAFTQDSSEGPHPCGPWLVSPQPFVGDGSIVQWYVLSVPARSARTITMTYKPI